jgi:hypothetical protein
MDQPSLPRDQLQRKYLITKALITQIILKAKEDNLLLELVMAFVKNTANQFHMIIAKNDETSWIFQKTSSENS